MNYNPDIHKRKSIRLKEYDYSQSGYYYVTICVNETATLNVGARHAVSLRFGHIDNGKMELNEYGEIVKDCVNQIPIHFHNAIFDYYCIMPNHLHIIIINDDCRGTACRAPTEQFGKPVPGSLPTIIRSLKSATTKRIN